MRFDHSHNCFDCFRRLLPVQELGLIKFEFDSDGPSQIIAWVPSVNASGMPSTWQPSSDEGSIEEHVDRQMTNGCVYTSFVFVYV
jgi:hypothetical protein